MIGKKISIQAIYYFGISVLVLIGFGCSGDKDEYSFPPMVYDEAAYLREIAAAEDLISLNETRANYAVALKRSKTVEEALDKKWDLLAGKMERDGDMIGQLSDELELWSFDFEKIGKDRCRLYFLFRVTGELKDNYGINLEGRLADPSRLSEPYREKGYRWWHFNPLPPTKFWEAGAWIVVREEITALDLPYELRLNFDSPEGRYGKQIPIGVMRKIEEIPVEDEEIMAEEDPFRLLEWLSYCHGRSGSKGNLVRRRYREVIAGLSPKALLEDGIEYLGARLERTGTGRGRLRLLFRPGKNIDTDYWFILYGVVADGDKGYLSESRRKAGKKSEEWYFPVYPAPTDWRSGVPIEVIHDLKVAPISYDTFGMLYDREEKKAGPRFDVGILDAPGKSARLN